MRRIFRKLLKRLGYDTRVRVIYEDEKCGHPECKRDAYVAFLLMGGPIYSCLEHFEEVMSRHGFGKQMYEVDGNEASTTEER